MLADNKTRQLVQNMLPQAKQRDNRPLTCFAPTNIALVKYWGKRDQKLNLPVTDSLSITLPNLGAWTRVETISANRDSVVLANTILAPSSQFYRRVVKFLDLVRATPNCRYRVSTWSNIPIAAGLASSACGFAALTRALDHYHNWQLADWQLSILARLGSGSACRSLWPGFVHWHRGKQTDGYDSFATPMPETWPDLHVGLLLVDASTKPISSRQAMQNSVQTSPSYRHWPMQVEHDLKQIEQAIAKQNIELLGQTAEHNAEAMHTTMRDSHPTCEYSTSKTNHYKQKIKSLRQQGLPVYYTQDAGPNLKLLFTHNALTTIKAEFPEAIIC